MTVWNLTQEISLRLLRNKIVIIAVLLSALIILMTGAPLFLLGEMKEANEMFSAKEFSGMMLTMILSIMSFFGNLVAVVMGVTVIRQDIKDATIFSVLSKPISRWQYFIASCSAALLTTLCIWLIFGTAWMLIILFVEKGFTWIPILALLCEGAKSLLLVTISIFWAKRCGPWVAATAAVLTLNGADLIHTLLGGLANFHIKCPDWLHTVLSLPFPSLKALSHVIMQLLQSSVEAPPMLLSFIHVLDYGLVALLLAWWVFKKMDLSQNT
jgi:ABC-type transport system involved in multi-copper enzyme maturation permease subunit